MKKILFALFVLAFLLAGCSQADVASSNVSKAADNFEINRRIKHYLGLSDNVTYFAEQLDPAPVNVWNYRVIFRPTTIIPDVELQTP